MKLRAVGQPAFSKRGAKKETHLDQHLRRREPLPHNLLDRLLHLSKRTRLRTRPHIRHLDVPSPDHAQRRTELGHDVVWDDAANLLHRNGSERRPSGGVQAGGGLEVGDGATEVPVGGFDEGAKGLFGVSLLKEGEGKEQERTSSGQSTDSLRQISLRRSSVLLTSRDLKRNFEQREVMGSMILRGGQLAFGIGVKRRTE